MLNYKFSQNLNVNIFTFLSNTSNPIAYNSSQRTIDFIFSHSLKHKSPIETKDFGKITCSKDRQFSNTLLFKINVPSGIITVLKDEQLENP